MASQISHIIYAKKYFDRLAEGRLKVEKKIDKDKFILGCVFPDIRRIEPSIKRSMTHLNFSVLDLDFEKISSFEAGWKFHLYCDMRREDILNKSDFYNLKNTGDYFGLASKLAEDELVYDTYNNWEKIIHFFNHPPYPALCREAGVTPETFRLWYAILAKYIENPPDDKTMRIFLAKQPGLAGEIDQIMASVGRIRENKEAAEILTRVSEEIV